VKKEIFADGTHRLGMKAENDARRRHRRVVVAREKKTWSSTRSWAQSVTTYMNPDTKPCVSG
jgi:hypothetical protein